jgi:predicted peptidase
MKTLRCLARGIVLSAVALLWIGIAQAADPAKEKSDSGSSQANAGTQQPCKLDRSIKVTIDYLLYLPKDYEQKSSWPLMLFLHGAGERGNDLDLVKKHGPPKLIAAGKEFPFIVASPQCGKDRWWEPLELAALLDDLVEKYKVDKDRIYLTGLSMGGFGTWSLAAYQPDRFAAIVPICGGGEAMSAKRIAHIPAWVFHGGKDPAVPLDRSQKMVDALKKTGSAVKFTIYPDAGHDSWSERYANPELYQWLLEQKRTAKTSAP